MDRETELKMLFEANVKLNSPETRATHEQMAALQKLYYEETKPTERIEVIPHIPYVETPEFEGGPWNKGSFHRMLTNERYTGVYLYRDIRKEGGIPPIIDREKWLAVQSRLKTKKNPVGALRHSGVYLLTGKLFCGHCGTPMVGISGTGKGGEKHYYYSCQKHRLEHTCNKKNVPAISLRTLCVGALWIMFCRIM